MRRERQYRRGDDISDFPVEKARLVGAYTLIGLSAMSTAGYGISLMEQTVTEYHRSTWGDYSARYMGQADRAIIAYLRPPDNAVHKRSSNLEHLCREFTRYQLCAILQ